MSPELLSYLRSWLQWIEDGAPDYQPYCRHSGLCSNAPTSKMQQELYDILGSAYPFGGAGRYYYDLATNQQHLNEERIAWVRKQVSNDLQNV